MGSGIKNLGKGIGNGFKDGAGGVLSFGTNLTHELTGKKKEKVNILKRFDFFKIDVAQVLRYETASYINKDNRMAFRTIGSFLGGCLSVSLLIVLFI